jgi:hypothetical protein
VKGREPDDAQRPRLGSGGRFCYFFPTMRSGVLLFVAACVASAASAATAQPSTPWPAPSADPLRFASLPLDLDAGAAPAGTGWAVSATVSYFNTWYLSWHPGAIHRELGREGLPLSSDELRTLEQRHPDDAIYFADLEGWRTDVRLSRALGRGLLVTVDVPWVDTTAPHWDAVAEEVHTLFQAGPGGRELFPRSRNMLYVRGRQGYLERLDGLDGSGIGDVAVSLAGPLGSWLGGEQRWTLALEAPTGERDTLRGSGGWDLGARWLGTWRWTRSELTGALGYTRLDGGGSFLGVERADTWHAAAAYRLAIGAATEARVIGRLEGSPLSEYTAAKVGEPGFVLTLGVRRRVGDGWVAFDLGENYPLVGVTPDYSFHLSAGLRFGPVPAAEAGR